MGLFRATFTNLVAMPEADHGPPKKARQKPDRLLADIASKRFPAILLDIDHSPQCLLHPGHAAFYTSEGLKRLTGHLQAAGVFALWSADPPEE